MQSQLLFRPFRKGQSSVGGIVARSAAFWTPHRSARRLLHPHSISLPPGSLPPSASITLIQHQPHSIFNARLSSSLSSSSAFSSAWSPPLLSTLDPSQTTVVKKAFDGSTKENPEHPPTRSVIGVGRTGTGKSYALAARAVHLLHNEQVEPSKVGEDEILTLRLDHMELNCITLDLVSIAGIDVFGTDSISHRCQQPSTIVQ